MWRIIICDGEPWDQEQLMELARQCLTENKVEAQISGCADWIELEDIVKQNMPDIVIVAQNGVDGLNTITSAKLLSGKIIWFSDLDFGVQAYRLCVPYFSQKPITLPKMQQALMDFIDSHKAAQTHCN